MTRVAFDRCATFAGAVALLSFFWESGGEIQWKDAAAFALDEGARKVAMSGSSNAMIASAGILLTSVVVKGVAHSLVELGVNSAKLQLELGEQLSIFTSFSVAYTNARFHAYSPPLYSEQIVHQAFIRTRLQPLTDYGGAEQPCLVGG